MIGRSEQWAEKALWCYSSLFFLMKCRWYGIACGSTVDVYGRVIVRTYPGCIQMGKHVQFVSSSWREGAVSIAQPVRLRTFFLSARIVIEDHVQLHGTSITCRSKTIHIGSGTTIAANCSILDSDHHQPWPPENRSGYGTTEADRDVRIGKNVWIGAQCMILKGVQIGDNAVVGAGSVVVHDVPANTLVAGNPARVVKQYSPGSTFEIR